MATTIKPEWSKLEERFDTDTITALENAKERVQHSGPGNELLPRVHVAHLRLHMEIFYEHGSTTDILALCAAFDLIERGWQEETSSCREQATLIEGFLAALGIEPSALLKHEMQQRPVWPR